MGHWADDVDWDYPARVHTEIEAERAAREPGPVRESERVAASIGLEAHATRERWCCDPETIGDGALGTVAALATGECDTFYPTDVLAIRRVMADYEIARLHVTKLAQRLDAVTAERDALAARLPSPAAVRAARVKAAERIEQWSVHGSPDRAREVTNVCADDIRDIADGHSGRHDQGGDVDEPTMLVIAQRVARCTTLGELEEMARELREVE